jgi:methylated-DNA-[protein]-cysteine S-methyltransferase
MRWAVLSTPIDDVAVAVDEVGVCRVRLAASPVAVAASPAGLLAEAVDQLRRYFAGALTSFDLPLSVHGGSDFERAVWEQLGRIPYGEMRTYGEVAAAVGDREAARAVGIACNRNPLPIVLPCHRVVGAGGQLVGFGAGLPRKRYLLQLEARVRIERDFAAEPTSIQDIATLADQGLTGVV